jgi:hypothetical protein
MNDVGMHTLFHKDKCKMVRGAMVLMKGFRIGTLYKLLENVDSTGCNNIFVPKVYSILINQLDLTRAKLIQTDSIVLRQVKPTMLWN